MKTLPHVRAVFTVLLHNQELHGATVCLQADGFNALTVFSAVFASISVDKVGPDSHTLYYVLLLALC